MGEDFFETSSSCIDHSTSRVAENEKCTEAKNRGRTAIRQSPVQEKPKGLNKTFL